MHELIWALVALSLLGLLVMLGVGRSTNNLMPSHFIGLDDLFEEGLFAAVFMVACMILILPLYPIYVLLHAAWRWYRPIVPPVPLPVEGDDPIWGRNVNRKVVEETFRAVQRAWMNRETESLKEFVGPDLCADLKRQCDRLTTQHEVTTRRDIHIKEINIHDEKINDLKWPDGTHIITYYFDVTIRGTMTNFTASEKDGRITTGSPDPQEFEETMQFSHAPDGTGPWWLVEFSGVPEAKKGRAKSGSRKRKRRAAKSEDASP